MIADGQLVFSKQQAGRHAEPGEVLAALRDCPDRRDSPEGLSRNYGTVPTDHGKSIQSSVRRQTYSQLTIDFGFS